MVLNNLEKRATVSIERSDWREGVKYVAYILKANKSVNSTFQVCKSGEQKGINHESFKNVCRKCKIVGSFWEPWGPAFRMYAL